MKMKKNDNYKEVEMHWIDKIPHDWEVRRVKDIGKVVLGKMLNSKPEPNYFLKPYLKSKNIGWLKVNVKDIEEMYFNKNEMKNCRVKKNDLLLSEGGEVGKTCIWNNELPECYIQNSVNKITIKRFVPRYFLYQSFALGTAKFYDCIVNQVSIKHLTWEKLNIVKWIVPPLAEQKYIALYLDKKTSAIDSKMSLLKDKITYYKELSRSLINETVRRSLKKNVALKESGIEYIKQVPKHWQVERFKSFAKAIKGKAYEYMDNQEEGSLPSLSLDYLRNENSSFTNYCFCSDRSQLISEKDYIIVWDGAGVGEILRGKIGVLSSTIAKLCFEKKKIFPNYFYFLRHNLEYTLKNISVGMGIPHLNPQVLNNFIFPIPSIEEQTDIADYLDSKTKIIDAIIKNIKAQIEDLNDLRKTLIYEVVTGKLKVTK